MGTNVWTARTVPASSAALKIAAQGPGDMGEYTSALPRWTPMLASSAPPLSACSISFIGSPTFTCEEVWVLLIWMLFTESHGNKMSLLSPLQKSPVWLIMTRICFYVLTW